MVSDERMARNRIFRLSAVGVLCAAALVGCSSGSTDGGSAADEDFGDGVFVADESSVGSLRLEVKEEELNVADTAGFEVTVKDAAGQPVRNLELSCDSEAGLAIIEPNTGREHTDDGGKMSGRYGCVAEGSHLFGCRLPLSGQRRRFATIKCSGPVPANFTGFPNAGGGGLGGGVGSPGNGGQAGGTSLEDVNLLSITYSDGGNDSTKNIDNAAEDDCDGDTDTVDPERFTDTFFKVKLQNDSNANVNLVSYRVTVPEATGDSTGTYRSGSYALNAPISPNGGTLEIEGILATGSGGAKQFVGSSSNVPDMVRSVTVSFLVRDENGNEATKSLSTVLSFADYNNCGG